MKEIGTIMRKYLREKQLQDAKDLLGCLKCGALTEKDCTCDKEGKDLEEEKVNG